MKKKSENILLVDKPKGITSFDCIRILRKKLGVRKMGHSGTLDPLATGLLIIGIGEGTKQLKDLIGLSKEYEAEILLGIQTDTGDMEGRVLREEDVNTIDKTKLEDVLNGLVGVIKLPVPAYSAIKRDGEALYKKARRGEKVEVPIKEMEIYEIELLDTFSYKNYFVVKARMKVKSGTYIRSIAEEIGSRLNIPATIKELRRTKVGEYNVLDAQSIK